MGDWVADQARPAYPISSTSIPSVSDRVWRLVVLTKAADHKWDKVPSPATRQLEDMSAGGETKEDDEDDGGWLRWVVVV